MMLLPNDPRWTNLGRGAVITLDFILGSSLIDPVLAAVWASQIDNENPHNGRSKPPAP